MKAYAKMMIVLAGMIATALVLQGMFEAGDHAKSERIVRNYRGAGGPTVAERLAAEAPGGVWTTEVLHGCRGYVRVRYFAPSAEYVFDYDVPQHRIHPGNPAGERILGAIPPSNAPPE